MKFSIFYTLILSALFLISCKSKKEVINAPTIDGKPALVAFVDSVQASEAIIADDVDGFFSTISALEMNIQMKNPAEPGTREDALKAFIPYLKTQVSNWSSSEKLAMLEVFKKVKQLCDTINPRIFPGNLRLIKIKNGHYGNDVYYTRGNNIMIPENIFEQSDMERQVPVMVHEVFHVLSRQNPQLRHDLYKLIGFEKADKPIKLNKILEHFLLTNPDGVSYQYYIQLEAQGREVKALPLITSKWARYKPDLPAFFDYLHFDLYKLDDHGANYMATSTPQGRSLIPIDETPTFFTKIKDNTQYIIHPDEIMADNFMLTLQAFSNGNYTKFSPEGKALVDSVLLRLQAL
jgi:hypothetical protein